MDKILTALDYAKLNGCKTVREYIDIIAMKMGKRLDTPITGNPAGKEVEAEINWGRWIAKCPNCNGAEDVDPNEPIFYCFSCGNYQNDGKPRPVKFPSDYKKIEKEILKRPVKFTSGTNQVERLANAIPVMTTERGILSRSWVPRETLDDLKEQNEPLKGL